MIELRPLDAVEFGCIFGFLDEQSRNLDPEDLASISARMQQIGDSLPADLKDIRSDIETFAKDHAHTILLFRGLPSVIHSNIITLFLAYQLGNVVKIEGEGDILMKIQPTPSANLKRPGHNNTLEFQPHTDMSYIPEPPEYMVIHGAEIEANIDCPSTFCELRRILADLPQETQDVLGAKRFVFRPADHYVGSEMPTVSVLYRDQCGRMSIRYRRDAVEGIDLEAARALARLQNAIDARTVRFSFQQGDAMLVSNRIALHGRGSYNASLKRVLNRAYVNIEI